MVFKVKTFHANDSEDGETQFNTWSADCQSKVSPSQSADYFKIVSVVPLILENKAVITVLYDTDIAEI